jgi:hypothetical protein
MKMTLDTFVTTNNSLSFFTEEDAITFYNFMLTNNIVPAMLLLINELKKYGWVTLNTKCNISLGASIVSIKHTEKLLNGRLDDFILSFTGSTSIGTNAFTGTYYIGDIIDSNSSLLVKNIENIFTHMILSLGANKSRFDSAINSKLRSFLDNSKDRDLNTLVLLNFLSLTGVQKKSIYSTLSTNLLTTHKIKEMSAIFNLVITAIRNDTLLFARLPLMQIRNANDYQLFVNKVKATTKLPALGNLLDIIEI